MAVKAFEELRNSIRRTIRDTHGSLWSDDVLDRVISDAQKEYAIVSGAIVGKYTVQLLNDGTFLLPNDFIKPIRFIGADEHEVPFYSWKYLHNIYPDFREIKGNEVQGIVTDFDGFGVMRTFPCITDGNVIGTLHYSRYAAENTLEAENVDALINHSLFQLLLIENKTAAGSYYSKFLADVNQEKVGKRGMSATHSIRTGRYF